VAEAFGDDLGVHADLHGQRRMRVPQVMECATVTVGSAPWHVGTMPGTAHTSSRKREERPAMKTLACKDMGVECDHVSTKPSAQEVKDDLLAHAQEAHSEMLAAMSEQDKAEMMRQMDERMKDVA
jgi:predicted small metal-binding protein